MSHRRSSSDPDLTGDKAHLWALKHHRRGLIQRVLPADQRHERHHSPAKRKSGYRINLAELQRMRLRALQIQLVDDVVDLCSNGYNHENNREWENHLEAYSWYFPRQSLPYLSYIQFSKFLLISHLGEKLNGTDHSLPTYLPTYL